MKSLLIITALTLVTACQAQDAPKKETAKASIVTDADRAKFYRAVAAMGRAESSARAAQQAFEAAQKDVQGLIAELKQKGCEAVEDANGLGCKEVATDAKAPKAKEAPKEAAKK